MAKLSRKVDFVPMASIGDLEMDWFETDKTHIFTFDLPGLKTEDVSLQILPGNVLQISGLRSDKDEAVPGKWHILERPRGSFLRQFKVPEDALVDELRAQDEDGVVTITIPKKKPLVRTIPIASRF